MITYVRSDNIFHHLKRGDILVHACNAQGVWGSGIALEFKKRFPAVFKVYAHWCKVNNNNVVGKCLLVADGGYIIGNLVTSRGYGFLKDDEDRILKATYKSVCDLIQQVPVYRSIVSPRINNGLFNIPWEKTEQVIRKAILENGFNIDWRVHSWDNDKGVSYNYGEPKRKSEDLLVR